MKRTLTALCLALTVLLSGCASMLQRSYSSSADHVEYTQTEDSNLLRAETYRGLVDAILYFVNAHALQGVVRLYNYTGSVNEDLDAACREVLREDPLAAFAVEDIRFECSRIVSYYEATLTLSYSHTAQEVEAIRFASGAAALRQELGQAISTFSPSLVLRLSYFPEDAQSVRAMAVQTYYDTPQAAFGLPEFRVSVYPDSGVQRIVEIGIQWPQSRDVLLVRSAALQEAAQALLDDPPGEDGETGEDGEDLPGEPTPESLALLLRQAAAPMDPAGDGDPYSALTGESANQLAHTLALELLLRLSGFEVIFVTGRTGDGDVCWLIVDPGEGWRHLLLTGEEPALYTDLELTAMGYLWNTESYPACVDYGVDLSGTPAAEPEESDQVSEP